MSTTWDSVSPTPAQGPIRPDLRETKASSGMSAPDFFCSSMEVQMPMIMPPKLWSVLKNMAWRFTAAIMPSSSPL